MHIDIQASSVHWSLSSSSVSFLRSLRVFICSFGAFESNLPILDYKKPSSATQTALPPQAPDGHPSKVALHCWCVPPIFPHHVFDNNHAQIKRGYLALHFRSPRSAVEAGVEGVASRTVQCRVVWSPG